jgi:hydroxymethylglutaryl-CoA reductase
MKILNVSSAGELAEVMAAVGLAQNLAAIKALATVGIQQGHMRLHARQVALAAGAHEAEVQAIAGRWSCWRMGVSARLETGRLGD